MHEEHKVVNGVLLLIAQEKMLWNDEIRKQGENRMREWTLQLSRRKHPTTGHSREEGSGALVCQMSFKNWVGEVWAENTKTGKQQRQVRDMVKAWTQGHWCTTKFLKLCILSENETWRENVFEQISDVQDLAKI